MVCTSRNVSGFGFYLVKDPLTSCILIFYNSFALYMLKKINFFEIFFFLLLVDQ